MQFTSSVGTGAMMTILLLLVGFNYCSTEKGTVIIVPVAGIRLDSNINYACMRFTQMSVVPKFPSYMFILFQNLWSPNEWGPIQLSRDVFGHIHGALVIPFEYSTIPPPANVEGLPQPDRHRHPTGID